MGDSDVPDLVPQPGSVSSMASNDFSIYILTYPDDFHLSSILVHSIQQVSPDILIMIIPFEDHQQYGANILPKHISFHHGLV